MHSIIAKPSWQKLSWERVPSWQDPRVAVLGALFFYVALGITVLGFNRSIGQISLIVSAACLLDVFFNFIFKRKLLFPLSGAISGLGLSILVNTAYGLWLPLLPVFLSIASKYLLTFNDRHIFNPTLFGLVAAVFISDSMVSPSPAYQWGGYPALAAFIFVLALFLFVFRIRRNALIIAFLGFYLINISIRAYVTQWHVPPQTLLLGTFTSPAFFLFTFFMITDPATSPDSKRGQIGMAFFIAALDLYLHARGMVSTLFISGFVYFSLVFIYRHARRLFLERDAELTALRTHLPRLLLIPLMGAIGIAAYELRHWQVVDPGDLMFTEIDPAKAGLDAPPGDILERIDPRIQHVGKWLVSVGDAVAVADVNNNGYQDVFLTYPLKDFEYRAALYLNKGNFQFERVPLPALDEYVSEPEVHGLPSGALFFDFDNDGDKDLLILTGYGKPRLLRNLMIETGQLEFEDASEAMGLNDYMISVTANVLDLNRNGRLDLLIGNAMNPYLADYDTPTQLNIFSLPEPAYENDRRMFNFMHRTWHNANNGGENYLYLNTGETFNKADTAEWGLDGTRWTLDIGTGDLTGDGWTDLYLANDFGPDDLYINQQGTGFKALRGRFVSELGRDTYKGMNSSLGDLTGNGLLDIYVSNVHVSLQAEGSMFWRNFGTAAERDHRAFRNEAAARNALNERRFGWGAALGDLDLDGRLDIVQANGMLDDAYDTHYEDCPDYWYWNEKIALTGPDTHGYADRWADLQGRCIFPNERNRVYLNRGRQFIDVAERVGWDKLSQSRGIALVDLNNNGALDAIITHPFAPVTLYRNDISGKNWLGLELVGNGIDCNRDAVGTQVSLELIDNPDTPAQHREVQASNGFSAQGDQRLLFGLGDYSGELKVNVRWCGDKSRTISDLTHNRYHRVEQGRQGSSTGNEQPITSFRRCLSFHSPLPFPHSGDFTAPPHAEHLCR